MLKTYCVRCRIEFDGIYCPSCGNLVDSTSKCRTPTCRVAIFAGDMFGGGAEDEFGKPATPAEDFIGWYCSNCASRKQGTSKQPGKGNIPSSSSRVATVLPSSTGKSRPAPGSEAFRIEPGSPGWEPQRTLDRINTENAIGNKQVGVGSNSRLGRGWKKTAPRNYYGPAFLTLALYWLTFWIGGIIANIIYINSANNVQKTSGVSPRGKGCLWVLLITHILILIGFCLLVSLGGLAAIFDSY
jgi:hypothetical protein